MHAYLIGGSPGAEPDHMAGLFREAMLGLPPKPLIAYVGVANGDQDVFRRRMATLFGDARLEHARLAKVSDSVPTARQIIADADAIFLSGGDVELGMVTLQDRGVVESLRAAAAAGKRIIGLSAGSILAGRAWVRFDDTDHSEHSDLAARFDCLGLVQHNFDAHAEEDDWAELRVLVRLCKTVDRTPMGLGLSSGGALRITNVDGTETITARGVPIVRIGVVDGAVTKLSPLLVA